MVRLSAGDGACCDVYDLTVADAHEFVASGVIVHNCTWACTPFLGYDLGFPDPYRLGAKRWAQSQELDRMAGPQSLFRRRVIAGAYGKTVTRSPGAWDLDTFAPQDDTGQASRPNVKQWS